MKRNHHTSSKRSGFTLIELTFSIAFLSMLALGATISFVNIIGIYNRAQGLTRTQDAARNAMDALSRDLVRTTDVLTTPAPTLAPVAGVSGVARFHCLRDSEGASERGYALLRLADNRFHLARLQNCSTLANYQLLAPLPTWSTSTASPVSDCADAFVIRQVPKSVPKVWQVTVRVTQGDRDPCGAPDANARDTLAATTVLSTHVVNQ
ncbi:hypothetical protein IT415_00330 [bacterium]|nr:hypothetical protein [bacterium]